jgi:hypothetical protein
MLIGWSPGTSWSAHGLPRWIARCLVAAMNRACTSSAGVPAIRAIASFSLRCNANACLEISSFGSADSRKRAMKALLALSGPFFLPKCEPST